MTKPPGTRFSEPVYARPPLPPLEELIAYYRAAGQFMLPHLSGRPLNLYRCSGERCFFQRNRDHPYTGTRFFRDPIRQVPIAQKNGRTETYLHIDSIEGIIACVEAKAIEFHAWGSRVENVERPDRIAFDLDPGEGVGFAEVRDAALQFKRSLEGVGLASWPLLTGGKGVHVIVPLSAEADWSELRNFAFQFCLALASLAPDRFTVALPKAKRRGRIFLDYLRNQRTATAIMPWSLRARAGAPVAVPLSWRDLAKAQSAVAMTIADIGELPKRAKKLPDWGVSEQMLPAI